MEPATGANCWFGHGIPLDTRRRAWRTPIGGVGSIFESGTPLTIGLWDYVLRSHVDFNFRAQPTLAPATGPQGYVTWLCHVVRTLSEADGINRERRAGAGLPAR